MRTVVCSILVAVTGALAQTSSATAIQDLPGLLEISVCAGVQPGYCSGINQSQLAAQPAGLFPIYFGPSIGDVHGGLSDATGNIGAGDEYFTLVLPPGHAYALNAVYLFFSPGHSPREEAPTIVFTSGLQFGSGYGPDDLQRALGANFGDTVTLLSGTLVFAWPSLVPEPTTLSLAAMGLMMLSVHARRRG